MDRQNQIKEISVYERETFYGLAFFYVDLIITLNFHKYVKRTRTFICVLVLFN